MPARIQIKPFFLLSVLILLTAAAPVQGQDNRSMYEAWTEDEQQFESLSSDYGYDSYGSELGSSDPSGLRRERPQFNQSRQSEREAGDADTRGTLPDQSEPELR